MALYARLIGNDRQNNPKLPVHQFCAALAEMARGRLTVEQVEEMFGLSKYERAEFEDLFAKVSVLQSKEIEDVLELAEAGMAYTTSEAIKARFQVEDVKILDPRLPVEPVKGELETKG